MKCHWCGREIVLEVLHNHSGYYLGYVCEICGPQTRETEYYTTRKETEIALYAYLEDYEKPEDLRDTERH